VVTLKANFYFADPYSSWERSINENANGLIRQYFPKSRNFTTITQRILKGIAELNETPVSFHWRKFDLGLI
jgi:IS30 family transposase